MLDKELFKLLGKNKKYIWLIVVLQILGLVTNISITASVCYSLFLLLEKRELISYLYPMIIVVIAILIRFVTSILFSNLKDKLGREVKSKLRRQVYEKTLSLGSLENNELNLAGLTQVSLEGIEQLDLYYSSYIPQFFYALISPVILFIVTVGFYWPTALMLFLCVPLIPVSIVLVSKYAKRIFAKYWNKYLAMGDGFLDGVSGLKELKIFQADAYYNDKLNENAEEFRKITMKVLVMQLASTTIMDLVAYGGAGVGIVLTLVGILNGLNPLIGLFLILIAVEFFLPLRAFGAAFHIAMNGISAGHKIIDFLKIDGNLWGQEKINSSQIELKNVSFSYNQEKEVLKEINMIFPKIGLTALVGESGSGKSTIANLIFGSLRANFGEVLVDNKNISSLDRNDYYSHLGVVSYNTYIFNDTVRNNFKLAKETVTDVEIYEVLNKVNLLDFIRSNGDLDKVISEDGSNISGGQKQRLALAINLVADKDIYIFDEATSNIDITSEIIIMENIKNLSKSKNVILISHRLANVVAADNIYFLQNGILLESGNHNDLMALKREYAKLYNMQKELENGYLKSEVRLNETK